MSVTAAITSVLYVPFRGAGRYGPVGTFSFDGSVTGDGSGGQANVQLQLNGREQFGFKPILLVKEVGLEDNLGTAEDVMVYADNSSERLSAPMRVVVPMVQHGGSTTLNLGRLPDTRWLLEQTLAQFGDGDATKVLIAQWETNTSSKVYHLHAWGIVFDEEWLARQPDGKMPEAFSGL